MEKQIPNKLFFKIGEVCEITDTQPYVLRYWESEFQALAPAKNSSGQRIYRRKDIETVLRIKQLLYEEGFTIAGAKKRLEQELSGRGATPQAMASLPETEVATVQDDERDDSRAEDLKSILLEVRNELRGMLTLLEKGGRKGN
jgi:DNA-binding transcriptional MerR regulator